MSKNKKPIKWIALVAIIVLAITGALGYFLLNYKPEPIKHQATIEKYAKEYDLDPALVTAVIYTESGFDDKAVSKADARGLMQIMPETGKFVAKMMKITDFKEEDLFDPETNIKIGCWYIDYLKDKFDTQNEYMAAYNGGENKVRDWLKDPRYSNDGKTLYDIPYPETKKYIEKIEKNYKNYKQRYEKEQK